MNLQTMIVKMCRYAQDIITEDNDPGDIEFMMVCTSHAVSCFLAQNTPLGNGGVETDIVLKELCELPKKSKAEWESTIGTLALEYGGWTDERSGMKKFYVPIREVVTRGGTMDRRIRLMELPQEDIDEMIHSIKSEEASEINNGGREAQVDYIMKEPWIEKDPFAHLSAGQKQNIDEECFDCDFSAAQNDLGYLASIVRDRWRDSDIASKLETISDDPECVKDLLGFDPYAGEEI